MDKIVYDYHTKNIEKNLQANVEEFKNNPKSSSLLKFLDYRQRILIEMERKIALEHKKTEYAEFLAKYIDDINQCITYLNEGYLNGSIENALKKLSFHEKVTLIGRVKSLYDNVNDPYVVLIHEVRKLLAESIVNEEEEILKSFNLDLHYITNKAFPDEIYEIIDDRILALDILYGSEEIPDVLYSFTKENNRFVFKDSLNGTEISIVDFEEDNVFDDVFIDKNFDILFVEFIVKKLIENNDFLTLYSLYDSKDLERVLSKHDVKVSNYEYRISYFNHELKREYEITENLDEISKKYFLDRFNKKIKIKINHEYFNPSEKFEPCGDKIFNFENRKYRIYKVDGQIVGMVSFQVFEELEYSYRDDIFNASNTICIYSLLGDDNLILEEILYDLMNVYKKDIIINIQYTENNLRNTIENLKGQFKFCLFVLKV